MSPPRWVSGPVRRIGRLLIGAGTRRQWRWLLLPTEACLRVADRLSADVSWTLRLGRVQEALGKWQAADDTLTRCLDHAAVDERRRAAIHYRQAQVRLQRGDRDGARAVLLEAVRLRPGAANWHAQLGTVHEQLQDWDAAAASYRTAEALAPTRPEHPTGIIRTSLKAGLVPAAVAAGESVLARMRRNVALRRSLAEAYEVAGDWPAAAGLLRELVAERPRDRTLRSRLARCLEQQLRVPPGLTGSGGEQPAEEELIGHLRVLAERAPRHPNDWFRLGQCFERRGRLAEAAEAYGVAMARLLETDASWCHKAAYDWEFRLAYVRGEVSPTGWRSPQLRRRVAPVAGQPDGAEPVGFVEALINRDGLQVSGFLLPASAETVDIYLDGQLVKQVRVNTTSWRPTFRYDLSPGTIGDLPERSLLTVSAGDRPLVTTGGGTTLEVCVPEGTGTFIAKLASGQAPNKKGSWPLKGGQLVNRQRRYLEIYQTARDFLRPRGRDLFLTYGTLLGCAREGDFIPGDDDFDASYVSRAADPESFRRECLQVALELLQHGLDIRFAINGRMLQAGRDNVWVDISPTWFYKGRAWSYAAHDLAPEAIEPVEPGTFAGRAVLLPRDPAALLASAYGPGWRTPQPAFRHYRPAADNQVLSTMWAKPSEVREFIRLAAAQRRDSESAGRFKGVGGTPAFPGFNWLTPAPAADQPAPAPPATAVAAGQPGAGGQSADR